MAMMKRQASIDGAHWVEYYEGDDLSGYKYKRKDNGNGWDVFHIDGRPFHGAGVAMSTNERPAPAIGQVWAHAHGLNRSEWVITAESNNGSGWPCRCVAGPGAKVGDVGVLDASAMRGGFYTFVRHAPAPITGILTANGSTPEAKPLPGRSSLVGSRWQGANDCFTVTADDCHGDCTMVELAWDDGSLGAYAIARLHVDFTRIQPTTSVGSGSAAKVRMCWKGTCGNPALVDRGTSGWCEPCLIAAGEGWRIRPEAHREDVAPTADVTGISWDGEWLTTHRADGTVSRRKPTAAEFHGAVAIPTEALFAKPKAVRHTYASLMASLRAEEGVPEPARCGACREVVPVGNGGICAACHAADDRKLWLKMWWENKQSWPEQSKPAPWQPSCDIDADIPEWNEFGSRKP